MKLGTWGRGAATVVMCGLLGAAAGCTKTIRFDTEPKDEAEKAEVEASNRPPPSSATTRTEPRLQGLPLTGAQIDLLGEIEFDTNSYAIKPTPRNIGILTTLVTAAKAYPQVTKLRVEGHTDSDGDDRSNEVLSDRRAQAVVTWLVENGVDRGRLLSVGCGERDPLAPNTSADGKRQNRRTEFDIEEIDGQRFDLATAHCAPNTFRKGYVVTITDDVSFTVDRAEYTEKQQINIRYSRPMVTPEGQSYWISLVKPTDPDKTLGMWHYVAPGATRDVFEILDLDVAEYEVRLHDVYPRYPYRVIQRTKISVKR